MASRGFHTPYEQPFFRDFYRAVHNTARITSRGINGPLFGRRGCGGANANGDLFRGRGDLIYSRPVVSHGFQPPMQHPMAAPIDAPLSASGMQTPRERYAANNHIVRLKLAESGKLADGRIPSANHAWPARAAWTRGADGTSLASTRSMLETSY